MRIAVLSNSATSRDATKTPAGDSSDSASVYSQASAAGTMWSDLTNPHERVADVDSKGGEEEAKAIARDDSGIVISEWAELANPHDRPIIVASVPLKTTTAIKRGGKRTRPTRLRSQTLDSVLHSSPTSPSARNDTLSPLSADADPGSAALTMRLALAQAVEAARRDSLFHAEEERKTKAIIELHNRPSSEVSAISEEVDRFEQDMQSWLMSPKLSSTPIGLPR